ncbi:hypothetical protein MYAM1_000224 [Malassezia yamatoensis]|uniref:DUF202 domain-containing protein n=1 Tax=Malassezia yamatoensis TaxID=253288 RepID=A0AAJ6CFU3_9BASI|nr:hypothetical protein MYAM1_000224 [Malassezia yamatoensis]
MTAEERDVQVHRIGQGFSRILSPFRKDKQYAVHPHKLLEDAERLDLRAAQRTFDGAYRRAALGQMTFALMVMRMFQNEFFWIGFANCVLSVGLLITSVWRYRMTLTYTEQMKGAVKEQNRMLAETQILMRAEQETEQRSGSVQPGPQTNSGDENHYYSLLPRFRTAGNVVLFITIYMACVQIAIVVLIATL